MPSGANSGSRSPIDDIDSGWEDMAEAASLPPAGGAMQTPVLSLAPVTCAPRPRSSIRAIARPFDEPSIEVNTTSASDLTMEVFDAADDGLPQTASAEGLLEVPAANPHCEDESAAAVRDADSFEAGASAENTGVSIGAVVAPTEVEVPDFRRREPGRVLLSAFVASLGVGVVAGALWNHSDDPREPSVATAAVRTPERSVPERAPEARGPAPAPEAAAEASREKTPDEVSVTVNTVPSAAIVFRAGQRLGTGGVEVSIQRNEKQRLTALHDGYSPANFVLDGSRDTVTIMLKRAAPLRAETVPVTDLPGAEPSNDANPAAAPSATADPVPEKAAPVAPSLEESPYEPSAE